MIHRQLVTRDGPDLAQALHPEVLLLTDEALRAVHRTPEQARRSLAPELAHVRLGVAVAHAWAWRLGRGEHHFEAARDEIDQYLTLRGDPGPPRALRERVLGDRGWGEREAIEAGSSLAWALRGLAPGLDEGRSEHLRQVVVACHRRLAPVGWRAHYINGNYAIPRCELAWATDRLTGRPEHYENTFVLLDTPERVRRRFAGYGWIGDDTEAVPLGAARGHYSETPRYEGRHPVQTFDPEYTQLQADRLARLWVLTGDARALRRLDAVHRSLLPHLDRETWQIDSTAGTRTKHRDAFSNAATVLLAVHAGTVTADFARAQFFRAVAEDYRQLMDDPDPYHLRGYGWTLVTLMLATAPGFSAGRALWPQDEVGPADPDTVRFR